MQTIAIPDTAATAQDLPTCAANYAPLSPLGFLQRTAAVYPDRHAVIYGQRRYTWLQTQERCQRLAAALLGLGVQPGDVVAVLAANTPELYEAHFGVPMAGAVLNALNTRQDPATIAYCLNHSQARVLITDTAFHRSVIPALALVDHDIAVIDIVDLQMHSEGICVGEHEYEALLALADAQFDGYLPADEWQSISLNYTSGTTGKPKGVVYSHRGAYLVAVGEVLAWDLAHHPVYLWTLPMFHCNGWCFPWTLAAVAGTSICLRAVRAEDIFSAIAEHAVTHLCGAPIVLDLIAEAAATQPPLAQPIHVMTAAAPPPAATLSAMEAAGFAVTHVYGLTEVYGPAVVCAWKPEWDQLTAEKKAQLRSRQGVRYHVQEGLMVADPLSLEPVPQDGKTLGEVFTRGNGTMKGYLDNPAATAEAFSGGWFHTGDLAVWYPDGYLQLKDRNKDIIISGGENISSIEIEDVLRLHPAVAVAAVVAKKDAKWGETPWAFIECKKGQSVTEQALLAHCRGHLSGFKCPSKIVFGTIAKTSTGKVQKFALRKQAETLD